MNSVNKLNQAIEVFKQDRTEANVMKVIMALMELTRSGETVLTPVKVQPRYYKTTPQTEQLYKVISAEGMQLHVCYTDAATAMAAGEKGAMSRVKWSDMLYAVVRQKAVSGLAVNPGGCDFVVNQQLCAAILQQLKLM